MFSNTGLDLVALNNQGAGGLGRAEGALQINQQKANSFTSYFSLPHIDLGMPRCTMGIPLSIPKLSEETERGKKKKTPKLVLAISVLF